MTATRPQPVDSHSGQTLDATLLTIIRTAIRDHPRSQQTRIGPSEIGIDCDRRIAHKLAGTPPVNDRGAPWLPTIGTAVHAWLQDAFDADNVTRIQSGRDVADGHEGQRRWLLEQKVTVGQVAGTDLDGHCDLYDTQTRTVVDWKIVGKTALTNYRRHGPGQQYRVQGHAYGRGWAARGHTVRNVACMFLPRNEELDGAVWWSEPYDEQVAVAALARVEAIGMAVTALGPAAPGAMSTSDAHCGYCPHFLLNATDLTRACPGDPARPKPNDSIRSLIA